MFNCIMPYRTQYLSIFLIYQLIDSEPVKQNLHGIRFWVRNEESAIFKVATFHLHVFQIFSLVACTIQS